MGCFPTIFSKLFYWEAGFASAWRRVGDPQNDRAVPVSDPRCNAEQRFGFAFWHLLPSPRWAHVPFSVATLLHRRGAGPWVRSPRVPAYMFFKHDLSVQTPDRTASKVVVVGANPSVRPSARPLVKPPRRGAIGPSLIRRSGSQSVRQSVWRARLRVSGPSSKH